MATFRAINATCEAVCRLLEQAFDPADFNGNTLEFSVYSTDDFRQQGNSSNTLVGASLYLYRVHVNDTQRIPPGRLLQNGKRQRPKLPVDLSFLITPWASEVSLQLTILGLERLVRFQQPLEVLGAFVLAVLVGAALVVALLDKGTRKRDRFQIAEALERRGAQLSVVSDGLRVRFSGRALPKDVSDVLGILSEELREPLFDEVEFDKARAYVAAGYHREMENTGAQAGAALSRLLFSSAHPNHVMRPEDSLEALQQYSVDDVRRYYAEHFSSAEGVIVFSGDLSGLDPQRLMDAELGDWSAAHQEYEVGEDAVLTDPSSDNIVMPDKSNSDVRLGHALALRRQDPDYVPLYVGNYILGGNFSARLMTVIRDQMGLTYGIWSRLKGITTLHGGQWTVGVTLSNENLSRGIEETKAEMARFVEGGITPEELEEKQTTIGGSFKVGLATTGGIAASLLYNAERGFDVSYLDHFPGEVRGLSSDQVNEVIRRHLDPERLNLAVAGAELG